jgi:hypothetical protein
MNITENICPACHTKNELHAIVCEHCGATLDDPFIDSAYKTRTAALSEEQTSELVSAWLTEETTELTVPDSGVAFYVDGHSMPAYMDSQPEFVLGRSAGPTSEVLLDFAPFGGYSLGLSRRHALIRRAADGYEVMDLGSVNGTWLDEEKLVPHQPRSLLSGSHLRLGRMRIFVLYKPFASG